MKCFTIVADISVNYEISPFNYRLTAFRTSVVIQRPRILRVASAGLNHPIQLSYAYDIL